MEQYIYRNELLKYLKDRNIIDNTFQITYTFAWSNYVVTENSVTKDWTSVAREDLSSSEQTELNSQLTTELNQYKSLNDYTFKTMNVDEIKNLINSFSTKYTDIQILPIQWKSCFNVLYK